MKKKYFKVEKGKIDREDGEPRLKVWYQDEFQEKAKLQKYVWRMKNMINKRRTVKNEQETSKKRDLTRLNGAKVRKITKLVLNGR